MNTAHESGRHPSRLRLERVLNGDLDPGSDPEMSAHLKSCEACAAHVNQGAQQAARFVRLFPRFADLEAACKRRVHENRFAWTSLRGWFTGQSAGWLQPAIGLAIVCLLAAGALWQYLPQAPADITFKGSARVTLFVNGNPVGSGDEIPCRSHDTLQLMISAAQPVYCWVLYQDDGCDLKVYIPAPHDEPVLAGKPDGVFLPHGIVLDSTWTRERLFCVWSSRNLPLRTVMRAIKKGGVHAVSDMQGSGAREFLLRRIE